VSELVLSLDGVETSISVDIAIVAGWAGRDRASVDEHIAELAELGVAPPSSVPLFYRVSASRLTTAPEIEAPAASSGEVEAVLLHHGGRLWVGVGSDHTDREVESYNVAVSKQMCEKPIGRTFWSYEDVAEHWDRLVLRSWVDDGVLYQEGPLALLLHPDELLAQVEPPMVDGTLLFCGTIAAIGGVRPALAFRYEVADPVRRRAITAAYVNRPLPLIS
jgi:uncharacterized protein DUF2848